MTAGISALPETQGFADTPADTVASVVAVVESGRTFAGSPAFVASKGSCFVAGFPFAAGNGDRLATGMGSLREEFVAVVWAEEVLAVQVSCLEASHRPNPVVPWPA